MDIEFPLGPGQDPPGSVEEVGKGYWRVWTPANVDLVAAEDVLECSTENGGCGDVNTARCVEKVLGAAPMRTYSSLQ